MDHGLSDRETAKIKVNKVTESDGGPSTKGSTPNLQSNGGGNGGPKDGPKSGWTTGYPMGLTEGLPPVGGQLNGNTLRNTLQTLLYLVIISSFAGNIEKISIACRNYASGRSCRDRGRLSNGTVHHVFDSKDTEGGRRQDHR